MTIKCILENWYSSPLKIDGTTISKTQPLLAGINWFSMSQKFIITQKHINPLLVIIHKLSGHQQDLLDVVIVHVILEHC